MNWDDLPPLFPGFEFPGRWLPLLQRHHNLLNEASGHTRVTAVAPEEAIRRHYAESIEIWRIAVEAAPGPVLAVDVGSGGGFPGIVAACLAPTVRFALVEPLKKRARLLEQAAETLGLANVEVHALRAEEAGRGPLRDMANIVAARAVAGLAELLEYTAPFARTGGIIALPKGSGLPEELEASVAAQRALGCEYLGATPMRPEVSDTLSVALFRKTTATDARYPRRPGTPHQRPLT